MLGSFYICGEFNCRKSVSSQVDHHLTQVLDNYNLLQHINIPIHIDKGVLDLIITSPTNPHVTGVHIANMGFLDHFVIISIIISARPDPCETRNFKAMDLNEFSSKLRQSAVFTALCIDTNGFTDQLRDCITGVLDELVPLRQMRKRCGKLSSKWLSS